MTGWGGGGGTPVGRCCMRPPNTTVCLAVFLRRKISPKVMWINLLTVHMRRRGTVYVRHVQLVATWWIARQHGVNCRGACGEGAGVEVRRHDRSKCTHGDRESGHEGGAHP